jgi:hypothetical protein
MGNSPMVPNGERFEHEYQAALAGFGVEPLA